MRHEIGKFRQPRLSPFERGQGEGALAGQTVDFVLTLRAQNDTPQQDYSLWIAPNIYRPNQ